MAGESPNFFINCKEKHLVEEDAEALLKHNLNMYESRNSTGVNKSFCCCKSSPQRVARKRLTNRTKLFFHLQNGTSWSPVLRTADVTELRGRGHAGHGQALLVEHMPAVEDHHAEGLCCV